MVRAALYQSAARLITMRALVTKRATVALALAVTVGGLSGLANAPKATLVPAFVGGVRKDALLKDPQGIITISSHCYDAASHRQNASVAAGQCIDNELKRIGAGAQAIAFADYAPVPAAIEHFTSYRDAAAVYAVMRWADGASGWCLIGVSGEAVGMWEPTGAEHDPKFVMFAQTHPNATLWMPVDKSDAPSVVALGQGTERFVFPFTIKTCHACAVIGHARIGFEFDRAGHYDGAELLSIASTPADTQ
jgi:hypothetical protein